MAASLDEQATDARSPRPGVICPHRAGPDEYGVGVGTELVDAVEVPRVAENESRVAGVVDVAVDRSSDLEHDVRAGYWTSPEHLRVEDDSGSRLLQHSLSPRVSELVDGGNAMPLDQVRFEVRKLAGDAP